MLTPELARIGGRYGVNAGMGHDINLHKNTQNSVKQATGMVKRPSEKFVDQAGNKFLCTQMTPIIKIDADFFYFLSLTKA